MAAAIIEIGGNIERYSWVGTTVGTMVDMMVHAVVARIRQNVDSH